MRRRGGSGVVPIAVQRANLERTSRLTPIVRNTTVDPIDAGGVMAEWVAAPGVGRDATLLYFHGGGYTVGCPRTHRALVSRLSRAAQARALSVDYRLAPENPFPSAVDDAVAAYRWTIERHASPERLVVAGDSAGGGLALSALTRLRDAGDPMPAGLVLLSPWTDLTGSGASMVTKRSEDVWLDPDAAARVAETYVAGGDLAHPEASPLFADHHGLPPTLIVVGTAEILLDDSRRLADAMRRSGVRVHLDEWTDMLHVFPAFAPFVPESRRAVRQIGSWIRRVVP